MKNKEWHQFLGFLSTPPLWEESGLFKLKQFSIPQVKFFEPPDFCTELPSLQTNYVLGKRIEDFYGLVFERSSRYKILAQGLQIFREKITVGELDFILEDLEEEKILHLEVVYKFYVYDPQIEGDLEKWIGPNRKDTLRKKIFKLEQKQLPLLLREETTGALIKLGVKTKNIVQEVSYLAHLFVPRYLSQDTFPHINNKGIAGTWIYFKEFNIKNYGLNEYYIPSKKDWPIIPGCNETWYGFEKIFPEVEKSMENERSPLIWMRTLTGNFERFFIVWW